VNSPEPSGNDQQLVSNETNDKINNLIPAGAITQLTRLVLTNAIYFDAAWQSLFRQIRPKMGHLTYWTAAPCPCR